MLSLDHIVLATSDLTAGAEILEHRLGVPPGGGGAHSQMGTHNKLWSLGGAYLELIAIDPGAAGPGRRRWFGLDRLADEGALTPEPQLITWVAASDALEADIARSPLPLGPVLRLRRGALHWDITVPEDGEPLWSGAYPSLIRWPARIAPPGVTLPETGLRHGAFSARAPAALAEDLRALGADRILQVSETGDAGDFGLEIRRGDGGSVEFRRPIPGRAPRPAR